jgi:hypothetical protein
VSYVSPAGGNQHVTRDDYLQADKKLEIETFNDQLAASLDDANFTVNGEGEFDSLYLQDIDDDLHSGIRCKEDETTPTAEDYGDTDTDDQPDDDDEASGCRQLPQCRTDYEYGH